MILTRYLSEQNLRPSSLAAAMGVPASTVTRWLRGERKPSPEMAIKIERLTGIPRSKLRPDLFEEAA